MMAAVSIITLRTKHIMALVRVRSSDHNTIPQKNTITATKFANKKLGLIVVILLVDVFFSILQVYIIAMAGVTYGTSMCGMVSFLEGPFHYSPAFVYVELPFTIRAIIQIRFRLEKLYTRYFC